MLLSRRQDIICIYHIHTVNMNHYISYNISQWEVSVAGLLKNGHTDTNALLRFIDFLFQSKQIFEVPQILPALLGNSRSHHLLVHFLSDPQCDRGDV